MHDRARAFFFHRENDNEMKNESKQATQQDKTPVTCTLDF
jgi:hypothetical protein